MRKYLPPLILFFLLLIGWQALALGRLYSSDTDPGYPEVMGTA